MQWITAETIFKIQITTTCSVIVQHHTLTNRVLFRALMLFCTGWSAAPHASRLQVRLGCVYGTCAYVHADAVQGEGRGIGG